MNKVNNEQLSSKLHQKERDLLSDLARLKGQARTEDSDVHTDAAATDQLSAETLQEVTLASRTLEQVQDALKRMDNGTYGNCVVCGKPIPDARLEAIPWTPYCIEDQEKIDRRK